MFHLKSKNRSLEQTQLSKDEQKSCSHWALWIGCEFVSPSSKWNLASLCTEQFHQILLLKMRHWTVFRLQLAVHWVLLVKHTWRRVLWLCWRYLRHMCDRGPDPGVPRTRAFPFENRSLYKSIARSSCPSAFLYVACGVVRFSFEVWLLTATISYEAEWYLAGSSISIPLVKMLLPSWIKCTNCSVVRHIKRRCFLRMQNRYPRMIMDIPGIIGFSCPRLKHLSGCQRIWD